VCRREKSGTKVEIFFSLAWDDDEVRAHERRRRFVAERLEAAFGLAMSRVVVAMTPEQLFASRRGARRKSGKETDAPPFVPAFVEPPSAGAACAHLVRKLASAALVRVRMRLVARRSHTTSQYWPPEGCAAKAVRFTSLNPNLET
jgi:hypothetical protein